MSAGEPERPPEREAVELIEKAVRWGGYVRPLAVPGWFFTIDHRGASVAVKLR